MMDAGSHRLSQAEHSHQQQIGFEHVGIVHSHQLRHAHLASILQVPIR